MKFYVLLVNLNTIGKLICVCIMYITGDITIGAKTVIHPKARIIAEAGPIIIGRKMKKIITQFFTTIASHCSIEGFNCTVESRTCHWRIFFFTFSIS